MFFRSLVKKLLLSNRDVVPEFKLGIPFYGKFQPFVPPKKQSIELQPVKQAIQQRLFNKPNPQLDNVNLTFVKNLLYKILDNNPKIFYEKGRSDIMNWAQMKHRISATQNFEQLFSEIQKPRVRFSHFIPSYAQSVAKILTLKKTDYNTFVKAIEKDFPEVYSAALTELSPTKQKNTKKI